MLDTLTIRTKRLLYRIRKDYLTLNNAVFAAAIIIALNWTWNSVEVMQQNYELQQSVDAKRRQVELETLRVETLELESKYYTTLEYQELAVRERLGKGMPGESALILPSTIEASEPSRTPREATPQDSNFMQWMQFLLGSQR